MIKTVITNNNGTLPYSAKVFSNHSLKVYNSEIDYSELSLSDLHRNQAYTGAFISSTGATQMGVNGSLSTPIKYQIKAVQNKIIFVQKIRFILESINIILTTGSNFRAFSSAGVLTNGILFQINQETLTNIFTNPVKTVGDFIDSASSYYNYANTYANTVDYIMAEYIFPKPIPIIGNDTDTIDIIIRDNITATATLCPNFIAVAYGWQSSYNPRTSHA